MIEPSRLLAMLAAHAREHGDLVCHWLPERVINYRRFWSRVERASARLQGEWGVQSGQTIAYVGHSHPDILVLYAALIRIGASFMPLEDKPADSHLHWINQADISLVIVDEVTDVKNKPSQSLPLLLADWCHFHPEIIEEDPSQPSLLLPVEAHGIDRLSLNELCVKLPTQAVTDWLSSPIFTVETLTNIVLPALRDLQTLHFSAIEQMAPETVPKLME
jgi:acyl-CoA synthetase (AMP-forming)/AMP-acid ligase II